jgi:hypothetical protein
MKRRIYVLIVLSAVVVANGRAQSDKQVNEPEYLSVFYSLDSSGQLVALERQIPTMKTFKTKRSFTMAYVIPGDKSPVRLKAGGKMEFIVRTDPSATIQFYRFQSDKDSRQLAMPQTTPALGKDSKWGMGSVEFNFANYGTSSLRIAPVQQLPPGEYCLSTTNTDQGYCFGIDVSDSGAAGKQPG